MLHTSLRRTRPLTLAIIAALLLLVAACGAAPTPTTVPVPPTATRAAPAPTATTAPAAPTAAAAAPTAAAPAAATATKPAAAPVAPTATTAPAAAAVSFSKDVLPIMQKSCTRCHAGNGARAGVGLDSYAAAMKGGSNGAAVVAGDPEKSPLYTLVKSGVMPFGGSKLPDSDAQKIFDWIKAGAPNN